MTTLDGQQKERLSDSKKALLEQRLRGREPTETVSAGGSTLPRVAANPEGRFAPFPLTPFQEEQRRASRIMPVTPWFYLETRRRNLDIDGFRDAWQALIGRHDMLRSVMLPDGRQKVVDILPKFDIPRQDLRRLDASEREQRLENVRDAMLSQPREEPVPPVDIRASRIADDEWRLHFGFSMRTFDLASVELMAADCRAIYEGNIAQAEPLPVGFRDVVLVEEPFRGTDEYRRARDYWTTRFATMPEPVPLPGAVSCDAPATFSHRCLLLEKPVWQAIKDRAKGRGLTDSMVVFTAFNGILAARVGRDHYALETRIFRRLPLHDHVYEVAGQYVAGVVSEVDMRTADDFTGQCREHERRTWQDLDNAFVDAARLWREHRDLPPQTPSVVYTSTIARFENFVQLGDEPPMKWFGEQAMARYQSPNLGLEFFVMESKGTLECHWFANETLVDGEVLERMFGDYENLMRALASSDTAWHGALGDSSSVASEMARGSGG